MNTCLICGKHGNGGIFFDGYWFDCEECVTVYCVFTGKKYDQKHAVIEAA